MVSSPAGHLMRDDFCNLTEPDYTPSIRAPRLPQLLSLFPLTRAAHAALYRDRLEDHEVFRRAIEAECTASSTVLDVGAGRGAPPAVNVKARVRKVIGVDVAAEIEHNPNLHDWHVGSVGSMPFLQSGTVDVAFARYVAEHLEHPIEALAELRRVLRPGGRFIFITPNRRHYVPAIASRVGLGLHRSLNALRGRSPEDTFPTVYALNTVEDIERIGRAAGFSKIEICAFECQPNYLTFHPAIFMAGVLYERLVNASPRLRGIRGSLMARLTV
jgi:SAM-dependent methyltransferase